MDKLLKITVITVCYNAERDIEKTIHSVINQTYDKIEYIIVDGASKDGTLSVVEKYKDKITQIVSEPDKGIYDAMNKGILLASGDYVIFMNVGDAFYDNDTVSSFVEKVSHNAEEIGVYYGDSEAVYSYGSFKSVPRSIELMPRKMVVSHQATFVRTDLLKSHLFDLNYRLSADYNQLSFLYLEGVKFQYVDLTIATCPKDDGATYNNIMKSTREHYAILKARGEKVFFSEKKTLLFRWILMQAKMILPQGVYNSMMAFISRFKVV